MTIFDTADLQQLIAHKKGICISVYMPTHKMGPDIQQDPIRLKNLLKKAEESLVNFGMRTSEIKDLLKPAYDLVNDNLYWSYQDQGLGIFIAPDFSAVHKLPIKVEEMVMVQDKFHLKPLLPLLRDVGEFFILALSQKKIRLFRGSRFNFKEIELEGVVKSIDETLKYDVFQKQTIWHGQRPGPVGKREGGIMHGHGGADESKEDVLRFLRDVDRGLKPILGQEKIPLILACVEFLVPIYKSSNTYPWLIDEAIAGNPDGFSPIQLHEQAWEIIEPIFRKNQEDAAAKYNEFVGTGRTAKDLKTVVEAAINARIEVLFVSLGVQRWGTFNEETNEVEVHSERLNGDEDLLDLAALKTFLNGGVVYAVDPEHVPDDRSSAAILRY